MSRRNLTRLARRALAVAALAVAALATVSGVPPTVARWAESADDRVDVPYVRDCKGIFRHPEECPPHFEPESPAALR
jgi:hypothetical protein